MKKIADKSFWPLLISIAIPMSLQNLLSLMISMIDTIMLGRVGEIEIASANLANQTFFIFTLAVFGLSGGGLVLCSQYLGKKDLNSVVSVISITIKIALLIAIVLNIVVFFFPESVMAIYTNDESIIHVGSKYLKIISFSYGFYGVSVILLNALVSISVIKVSIITNVLSLIVNFVLNWIFIFGNLGFPKMGIEGAALSTLFCRIIEFSIVVFYIIFIDKKLTIKISHIFKINFEIFKKFIKYSVPVVFNELVWAIGISYHSMVFGRMGAEIVSANAISLIIQQFSTVIIFGISSATAVVVGRSVGEGDVQKVKYRVRKILKVALSLGILSTIGIMIVRNVFVDFYNVSEYTKNIARQLILAAAFVAFLQSLTDVFLIGVLRGGGDTKFALGLEFVTIWCIALPLCTIGAFVFKFSAPIVYLLMKIDEPIKVIVCLIRTRGTKWIKNI